MTDRLAPTRRTLTALAAAALVLAVGYLVVGSPEARYGAWLVVFALWMAWFVSTAVEWISNADF